MTRIPKSQAPRLASLAERLAATDPEFVQQLEELQKSISMVRYAFWHLGRDLRRILGAPLREALSLADDREATPRDGSE